MKNIKFEDVRFGAPLHHIFVTQEFGQNFWWYNKKTKQYESIYASLGLDGHNGRDYKCAIGCEFLSPIDGKITKSVNDKGFGQYIEITSHIEGYGYKVRGGHLSERYVGQGQDVYKGQPLGKTGNSGTYTTGPHLHLDAKIVFNNVTTNYNNGFFGAINFKHLMEKDCERSRAFHRYGRKRQLFAEKKMRFFNPWLHKQLIKRGELNKVFDDDFINALVYGGWDFEHAVTPSLFTTSQYVKKDEYDNGIYPFTV